MRNLIFVAAFLATVAADCSSGDTAYMCLNLNRCWTALGFSSREELKYLCDVQGLPTESEGGGGSSGGGSGSYNVVITMPPRNITVPPGAVAQFACTAEDTVKVMIVPRAEDEYAAALKFDTAELGVAPSSQKVIQVIDEAYKQHEGWYRCVAYGPDGMSVSAEAYLEIRDICAGSNCNDPTVCRADAYTGTFECVCPDDCDNSFDPVCGTDCASYFNECTMKKETCEKGLIGVRVASRGLCAFTPSAPYFTQTPQGGTFSASSSQRFQARASGTPNEITYTWYVGNARIGEGADFLAQLTADMSGEWRVEAGNCAGTQSVSHRFTVTVEQNELVEPVEQCCRVYGDPHVATFDGLKYDYTGSCTYVIAQDSGGYSWMVYGTYTACGDRTKQLSCIVSITVHYENEAIQFLRMFRINYRGSDFAVPLGQTKYVGRIKIENRNFKYYISLGDTGVRVMWDGITNGETCLPKKCAGGVTGMCGNADCDASEANEFAGYSGSSAFGNSWVVGDSGRCDLEPEDGNLAVGRKRPCDLVTYDQRSAYEARCNSILNLSIFSNCLYKTTADRDSLFANCMFDSCAGLTIGAGCANSGDQGCDAEISERIAQAIAMGMSRYDAEAKYRPRALDPACMAGMALANDCRAWGVSISDSWRVGANCPDDNELALMIVCP